MGVDPLTARPEAAPRRAVFLDRDGVLNRTLVVDGVPRPPFGVREVEVLPGVHAALARLAARGLVLVGVTNQPDVARGRQDRETVEAINRHLVGRLPLAEILTCFHDDADGCTCRKPKPGLILEAAQRHRLDLAGSFLVGDRCRDVLAGQAAGCLTFLIEAPYNRQPRCTPRSIVADLSEAADRILELLGERRE